MPATRRRVERSNAWGIARADRRCSDAPTTQGATMTLSITSPDFQNGGAIPAVHTCDGANTSPALTWTGIPDGARSLVLIVDDPDAPDPAAPQRTWVHWLLYNIPAKLKGLPAGLRADALPEGAR